METTPGEAREGTAGPLRWVAVLLAVAVVGGTLAWFVLREDVPATPPAAQPSPVLAPSPAPTPVRTDPCEQQADGGFVPERLSIPGVVRGAVVRDYPRDGHGVPGVPPVSEKKVVAWDRGGVQPGSAEGHVLMNTHTWPDGSALGNQLLAGLEVGGRLVLTGQGQRACYRVSERVEVRASAGYPGWDATDGPSTVVIVVCSGERLGPGNWSHRTLWFAERIAPGAA